LDTFDRGKWVSIWGTGFAEPAVGSSAHPNAYGKRFSIGK